MRRRNTCERNRNLKTNAKGKKNRQLKKNVEEREIKTKQ